MYLVRNESTVASVGAGSPVGRLAQFFPDATPVRIPVRITRVDACDDVETEQTVIEFGTPREVIFASRLPLEFASQVRLENSDGSLNTEASVVAMQFHDGSTAVAARFAQDVSNWIVKVS